MSMSGNVTTFRSVFGAFPFSDVQISAFHCIMVSNLQNTKSVKVHRLLTLLL